MNLVAFMSKALGIDKTCVLQFHRKFAVDLINPFLGITPWALLEDPHLTGDEGNLRGIQFLPEPRHQVMQFFLVDIGQSLLRIRLSLMPKNPL